MPGPSAEPGADAEEGICTGHVRRETWGDDADLVTVGLLDVAEISGACEVELQGPGKRNKSLN